MTRKYTLLCPTPPPPLVPAALHNIDCLLLWVGGGHVGIVLDYHVNQYKPHLPSFSPNIPLFLFYIFLI